MSPLRFATAVHISGGLTGVNGKLWEEGVLQLFRPFRAFNLLMRTHGFTVGYNLGLLRSLQSNGREVWI